MIAYPFVDLIQTALLLLVVFQLNKK